MATSNVAETSRVISNPKFLQCIHWENSHSNYILHFWIWNVITIVDIKFRAICSYDFFPYGSYNTYFLSILGNRSHEQLSLWKLHSSAPWSVLWGLTRNNRKTTLHYTQEAFKITHSAPWQSWYKIRSLGYYVPRCHN